MTQLLFGGFPYFGVGIPLRLSRKDLAAYVHRNGTLPVSGVFPDKQPRTLEYGRRV